MSSRARLLTPARPAAPPRLATAAAAVVLVAASCAALSGADWPCLQGPDQSGVSAETDLSRAWPPSGPALLWTAAVGPGYGGPAIRDGELYLLDREDDARNVLRCLDVATGRELWRHAHAVPGRLTYNGSRSVPTVGPRRVYAVGPFGHLYCVDRRSHRELWRIHLLEQFAKEPEQFGVVQAPLLYGDTVIIAPASATVGMVALDGATGREVWRTGPLGTRGYVSPRLHRFAGRDGVLLVTDQQVCSVEAGTGAILWACHEFHPPQPIAFPTVLDDGRLFVTAADDAGSIMIQVARRDAGFHVTTVFTMPDHGAQLHPPIHHNGFLYGKFYTYEVFPDGQRKLVSRFLCIDMAGRIRWQAGTGPVAEVGSWIGADGVLFVLDAGTGELSMLEAAPDGHHELGRARVLDGGDRFMITPLALSDGRLFVRDQHELRCLDLASRR